MTSPSAEELVNFEGFSSCYGYGENVGCLDDLERQSHFGSTRASVERNFTLALILLYDALCRIG